MNVALLPEQRAGQPQPPVAPAAARTGPWEQAIRLAFGFLALGVLVLALGWVTSNVRQVPPDSRAVVLRLGAFAREQDAGLLLAWPAPLEEVLLLPAADRQLELAISRFGTGRMGQRALESPNLSADPRRNTGFLLTGDAGIVNLRASLLYGITEPAAYVVARAHVPAALERLFIASAVGVLASRDLDAVLVARPGETAAEGEAQGARERLRADLMRETNARLQSLADQGASLGVRVRRVDVIAALPSEAKDAFDEVLRTAQFAEAEIAQARTIAAGSQLSALQQSDSMLANARAAAAEQRAQAITRTASITALTRQAAAASGRAILDRIYAERIGHLLNRAARVELLDPRGGTRLLLPGSKP